MGLKIEHMDETTLKGTLDGMLPVTGSVEGDKVKIAIAGFLHELSCDFITGAAALRHAVYSAIAQYRNAQRFPAA
jgi:hypothetical protein